MQQECLRQSQCSMLQTEKAEPKIPLSYQCTTDEVQILHAYALMSSEFVSHGGNIRDIDFHNLRDIALNIGELWTASDEHGVYASFTVVPIVGSNREWGYLNNGIVEPNQRHRGGMIMENLLSACLKEPGNYTAFFTISTARSIFTRLGFSKTDIAELEDIDETIAEITKQKLRPDVDASIFIKIL